jgi:hypothetical protein
MVAGRVTAPPRDAPARLKGAAVEPADTTAWMSAGRGSALAALSVTGSDLHGPIL